MARSRIAEGFHRLGVVLAIAPAAVAAYFCFAAVRDALPAPAAVPWSEARYRLKLCKAGDIQYVMPPDTKIDFASELLDKSPPWEIYGGQPTLIEPCAQAVRTDWIKSRSSSASSSIMVAALAFVAALGVYAIARAIGWITAGFLRQG